MYAERKGWPLRHVSVALKHSRIHAEDCANCESGSSHLDHIERVVTIDGDLSNQQRDNLMRIAEKCPVHRTLEFTFPPDSLATNHPLRDRLHERSHLPPSAAAGHVSLRRLP